MALEGGELRKVTTDTVVGVPIDDLASAIGHYVLGENSLGRVTEWVGATWWELQTFIREHGVEPRLGPTDLD